MIVATFSERLKEAMMIRHVDASDIFHATNIPYSSLSHYMSGRNRPKSETIVKLADYLDVNFMWLSGHDAPLEPPSKQKISTEQIIETMRVYYGEGAGRMITNYLMLNEYGQLKVADYIQTLLMDRKYRSEI